MFLDTSILIDILTSKDGSTKFNEILKHVKDEPIFISIIQIGEITDWCLKNNIDAKDRILKVKEFANIIPLNENICIEGSIIKKNMRKKGKSKFGLIDGIILASARSINQEFLTKDRDFQKAKDVILLK